MTAGVLIVACLILSFANGANDNFKGVATLLGSRTTTYRRALAWATSTTLLGSIMAIGLAATLLRNFSGKGLVDETLTRSAQYLAAVALGAGLTVLFATRLGMPVSTTHSLVGALVGAGFAAGSAIDLSQLGTIFLLPLLLSPILAIAATALAYSILRRARERFGINAESCLCVGNSVVEIIPSGTQSLVQLQTAQLTSTFGDVASCRDRYQGNVLGMEAGVALDRLHYFSAGVVSFARGLNDTPKIAALLLLVPQVSGSVSIAAVGMTIAVGGLLRSRRVAETMSRKITLMNPPQGCTANLLTGLIVIGASQLGMPASTTHVSCGALFGIGAVSKQARWGMIGKILAAWVTTLPLGAALGAVSFWGLQTL